MIDLRKSVVLDNQVDRMFTGGLGLIIVFIGVLGFLISFVGLLFGPEWRG
jgi:hypothetical protein